MKSDERAAKMSMMLAAPAVLVMLAGCAGGGAQGKSGSVTTTGAARAGDQELDRLQTDLRQVVARARDRVFPALVNITVTTIEYFNGQESKNGSTGSGTLISAEGYVITNQHVVDRGKKFEVTLASRQVVPARLVGEDPLTDLAVLQIDLSKVADPKALVWAEFGDSDEVQTGDTVMAMGSPFSLSRSVTLGIVSNTERVFTSGFGREEMEELQGSKGVTGLFTRWIQHDAAINPGNSGGPLINLKGQIVGVNTLGGSNLAFASPSNLARQVAEALIARGEVVRSYSGISFKHIRDTGYQHGVLVNSVVEHDPAYEAGLRAGDLITAIGYGGAEPEAVTVRFVEELPPLMKRWGDVAVGGEIRVKYERAGTGMEAKVVTRKLEREVGDEAALRLWGFSVEEITPQLAKDLRLEKAADGTYGVLVTGTRSGSPAEQAEPELQWGDVIRRVGDRPVGDLKGLVEAYRAIMANAADREKVPEFLLIQFERQRKDQVTLIKPRPPKKEDPAREVPKAWLGVATQPVVRDLARELGHPEQRGFRVSRIYPGTTAAASELKVGDVILAVNGNKVQPSGMQDAGALQRLIRQQTIDKAATIDVLRKGEDGKFATRQVAVNLERTRLGPEEARRDTNPNFELTVREVTFFDRDDNRWDDDIAGVIVDGAEQLGWAGVAGISGGDLIMRIADRDVKDLDSYRKVMDDLAKEQPERVVFVVLRGTTTLFRYTEPEWKAKTAEEVKQNAAEGKE